MKFTDNLKKIRKRRGLKQSTIAELIGIGTSTYTNYELGRRMPDLITFAKIAQTLNVTSDELLGLSKPKESDDFNNLKVKIMQLKNEDLFLVEGYVDKLIEQNKELDLILKRKRGGA